MSDDGICIGFQDIDWNTVLNDASDDDLAYLERKVRQKRMQKPRRKILIRGEG